MTASWTPCRPEDVVVGDAVALSGRDPTGDAWTLSGRVRYRGETGTLAVEWTTATGDGDPPWRLWSNSVVRRDRLLAFGLRRHPAHGPAERTDAAGLAYLHDLAAGVDESRLARCVQPGPGGMPIGDILAREIVGRMSTAPEWALRQLDGRLTAEAAKAYVPTVQASRTPDPAPVEMPRRPAGPRLSETDPIYDDPDIRGLLAGLPGAYVREIRHRRRTAQGWVDDVVG